MKLELTDEDLKKLKKLNLFRLKNDWYLVATLVTIFYLIYSFFFPYYGWRYKPTHIPQNNEEYLHAIINFQLIIYPLFLLILFNFLIKRIEIKNGFKNEKRAKVLLKLNLFSKKKLIVFKPFRPIFYTTSFRFNDLEIGDEPIIGTTYFGRMIYYKK